jgi:hypothetical protein
MTTARTLIAASRFTAADRCDRCNARASLLAVLHTGGHLLLCGYHASVHRSALRRVAEIFEDFAPRPSLGQPVGRRSPTEWRRAMKGANQGGRC